MVTASHNPPDYNGMKFVREGSRPISGDTGLQEIRAIAEAGKFTPPTRVGERSRRLALRNSRWRSRDSRSSATVAEASVRGTIRVESRHGPVSSGVRESETTTFSIPSA